MNTNTNSPLKSTKETNQQQQQEQQHVPPEPKPRVTVILKPPPPNEPPETEKDSVSSENIKQTNEEESSKSPLPAIKENDQNKTDNLNDDKCKQNSLSAKPEVINQVDPLSAVETVISRSPSPAARSIKRDNSNQEKETLLERVSINYIYCKITVNSQNKNKKIESIFTTRHFSLFDLVFCSKTDRIRAGLTSQTICNNEQIYNYNIKR